MKEYRICEACDHNNDVSYLECEECGADLSYIHPTVVRETDPAPKKEGVPRSTVCLQTLKLVNSRDGKEILIPFEGGCIGRGGDIFPDYFATNPYISYEHARIQRDNDRYLILDNHSTNGTRLNGSALEKEKRYPLKPGDHLTLANWEFIIQE